MMFLVIKMNYLEINIVLSRMINNTRRGKTLYDGARIMGLLIDKNGQ